MLNTFDIRIRMNEQNKSNKYNYKPFGEAYTFG